MLEIENVEVRDPYGFIYITTNLVNGKRYLGQKVFKDRGWKGYLGSGTVFKAALNLYKKGNFHRDIIHICYSEEELNNAEYELSVFLNVVEDPDWYNVVYGGGATTGWHHSEELKKAQSERAKKQWEDEEYRRKHIEYGKTLVGEKNPNYGNHKLAGENNPNYGKTTPEEVRKKISEANSNPSEETRKKMSDSAKARMTPEAKEHLRQINIGRKATDEQRKKMSESHLARWTDELREEYSAKYSGEGNPMYGKHHSEETKEKLREMFSGEKSCKYGKHPSEETLKKMQDASPLKREVIQLSLTGEYIAKYQSIGEAERVTGISRHHISSCCSDALHSKSAGRFLWVYKENYIPGKLFYVNKVLKPVVKLNDNFDVLEEYISVADAARSVDCFPQNLGNCCKNNGLFNGKIYKCRGFIWMYLEDYQKLIN